MDKLFHQWFHVVDNYLSMLNQTSDDMKKNMINYIPLFNVNIINRSFATPAAYLLCDIQYSCMMYTVRTEYIIF